MRTLFDRIVEPLAETVATPRQLRDNELESIENELNRLLNTRSYFSGQTPCKTGTILDYGLDKVVDAGANLPSKVEDVVANVRRAVEVFEPRVLAPIVRGRYDETDPTRLWVTVAGTLRKSQEPVQFKIPLRLSENRTGRG